MYNSVRRCILAIVLFASAIAGTAQSKTTIDTAENKRQGQAILNTCFRLYNAEKYDSLITESKAGLRFAEQGKFNTAGAMFSYFEGVGLQSTGNIDSALRYYKVSEKYGHLAASGERIVVALGRISALYVTIGNLDSVNAYKDKLLHQLDTIQEQQLKYTIVKYLAYIYNAQDQYEKALDIYFRNLAYTKQAKDKGETAVALVNIGSTYLHMNQYGKALQYLSEAVPDLDSDRMERAACFEDISDAYLGLKLYDSAALFAQRCIENARVLNDSEEIFLGYQKLGMSFIGQQKWKEAVPYLLQARDYFLKADNASGIMDAYTTLGELEKQQGYYTAAAVNYKAALNAALKAGYRDRAADIYYSLAESYNGAGLFKDAYQAQLSYTVLKDSLAKEESKKTIAEFDTKYQTAQKEQQISILNGQARIRDIELKNQHRTWWFLFAAFCLVLLVALLVFRSYRIKRRSNLQLEQKNTELDHVNQQLNEANQSKTKLFSIISHDLRSPLSSLFYFLELQKKNSASLTGEQQEQQRDRITRSASDLLEAMEDLLYWSKSQMERFEPNNAFFSVHEIFDEIVSMHTAMADQKNIKLHTTCPPDLEWTTDPNFFKIILRNLVSNAIKFTPPGGNVYVSGAAAGSALTVTVRDDGPGMTAEQAQGVFEWNSIRSDSSGLGLRLTKEFVDKLAAGMHIDTAPGKGTSFAVTFKAQMN